MVYTQIKPLDNLPDDPSPYRDEDGLILAYVEEGYKLRRVSFSTTTPGERIKGDIRSVASDKGWTIIE